MVRMDLSLTLRCQVPGVLEAIWNLRYSPESAVLCILLLLCGSDSRPLGRSRTVLTISGFSRLRTSQSGSQLLLSELPWAQGGPVHSSHLNRIPAQSLKGRTASSTTSTILYTWIFVTHCLILPMRGLVWSWMNLEDKSDTKGQILYDFIYMSYLEESIQRQKTEWCLPGPERGE